MSQTVLITGASVGIGYELSKIFAANGFDLVLVARNRLKLEELAAELKAAHKISAAVITKDLSQHNAAHELYDELRNRNIPVDILVNNAGFGMYGFFAEGNEQEQLDMIQLNISALTQLSRLFIPDMLSRGSGKILNVASTAAFQPGPLMAVYYATKAYVLSLSEALANELADKNITVTALCPGPTRTNFQAHAGISELQFFTGNSAMDARTVAEAGYKGLMKGQRAVIPGMLNKVLAFSNRFAPRSLSAAIVRRIQEKRH